jgi:non-specific riboncleoside hydrolase
MNTGLRCTICVPLPGWCVPELFTLQSCFVAVETQGEYTSGTTVVDIEGRLGHPANAQVALGLNVEGFQQWVAEVATLALISALYNPMTLLFSVASCLLLISLPVYH